MSRVGLVTFGLVAIVVLAGCTEPVTRAPTTTSGTTQSSRNTMTPPINLAANSDEPDVQVDTRLRAAEDDTGYTPAPGDDFPAMDTLGQKECTRPYVSPQDLQLFDTAFLPLVQGRGTPPTTLALSDVCGVFYELAWGTLGSNPNRPAATNDDPVPTDALLRTASMVKPVTAAIIQRLVAFDKIEMTDFAFCPDGADPWPVGNCILTGFENPAGTTIDPRWYQIQVQHLLSHTGGWDRGSWGDPLGMARQAADDLGITGTRAPTPEDWIDWMSGQGIQFNPGGTPVQDGYSNFGFQVLGAIIDKVTAEDYVGYVHEYIFGPIGVSSQDFQLSPSKQANWLPREPGYGCGTGTWPGVFPADIDTTVCKSDGGYVWESTMAHGGFTATAAAMAEFFAAFWSPFPGSMRAGLPRSPYMTAPAPGGWTDSWGHTGRYGGVADTVANQCTNGWNGVYLSADTESAGSFPWATVSGLICNTGDTVQNQPPFFTLGTDSGADDGAYFWDDTHSEFQQTFNALSGSMRLLELEGYDYGGVARYASSWGEDDGTPWRAIHGVTKEGLEEKIAEWRGFIPVEISGFNVDGDIFFSAIFEGSSESVVYDLELSSSELGTVPVGAAGGLVPWDISAYRFGNVVKYTAIWGPPRESDARSIDTDLTVAELTALVGDQKIVDLTAYQSLVNQQVRYSVILSDDDAEALSWNYALSHFQHHGAAEPIATAGNIPRLVAIT